MRCLFLINPSSGKKIIQKKLDKLIGQMILDQIVNHVDVFYTQKKNDAYQKLGTIKSKDYDFLISVGGDGTVNEVINGIMDANLNIPLAILPGGTVNDFSNHLGLPKTSSKFIQMLREHHTIKVDIGKVDSQYFINVLAGGMFSDISFHVSKADKERFGSLAYYLSGLRQLPTQLNTSLKLKVTTEKEEFEEDASLFMVTNTSQVGGFKAITPRADIQDGEMDLLIIKKCSTTDMISLFKDYKFNSHIKNPYIRYVQAKDITITCDKPIIYDIDGEQGETLPIRVTTKKQAISIIVPKSKSSLS